jgi:outer membrane protein
MPQAAQPAMGDMPAPPPPPTRRYTLREALQEALGAPIITRRRELIEGKAQSRVDLARSEYLPTVRANARVDPLRTKDISGAADEAGGLTRDRARVSLSASLPLVDGGRRRAAVNEALAEQERDRHQMRGRVDELANRVVAVYFRLLRQHRFYDASLQKVAATRQHLRDARVRYELGAVTRLDVLTAQNALSEALADVEQYVRQIAEARAHLAQLLSADPRRRDRRAADARATRRCGSAGGADAGAQPGAR